MARIVIDIPDYMLNQIMIGYPFKLPSQFVAETYKIIRNGKVLPKGHGRLIDADAFERRCMFDSNIEDMQDVIYALRDYKPIIEADKEEA